MFRHRNEYPVEGELPSFAGATTWLNSDPLTAEALAERVVLVSFGTYTCINWIRSLPYVRAWADKYRSQGLTVVGVQTPEFDFEEDLDKGGRARDGGDGGRRADAGVRFRGRPRQGAPRHERDGRPLPGGGGQRLRRLAGVRQPLLARPLLRRRGGPDPPPPFRRGRVHGIGDGPPDAP